MNVRDAADLLLEAENHGHDCDPLTERWPKLDVKTAYEIQDETMRRRVERGERLIGVKLGLTSRAKQERMGISTPLTAWLTDAMQLAPGAPVPLGDLIHPRAEPEIVFRLGRELSGPGVTAETALAAVDSVYCGVELIDSRYRDFKFSLADVVADNASSGRFVLGPVSSEPMSLNLASEAAHVFLDGSLVETGTGAEVQGHPAEALALAANDLAGRGWVLQPGWLVLTGGMTDAVAIQQGSRLTVEFTNLGSISLNGDSGCQ